MYTLSKLASIDRATPLVHAQTCLGRSVTHPELFERSPLMPTSLGPRIQYVVGAEHSNVPTRPWWNLRAHEGPYDPIWDHVGCQKRIYKHFGVEIAHNQTE